MSHAVGNLQVQDARGRWVPLKGVRTLEHAWLQNTGEAEQTWTCVRCGLTEGLGVPASVCPGYTESGPSSVALADLRRRNARAWWGRHGRRAH